MFIYPIHDNFKLPKTSKNLNDHSETMPQFYAILSNSPMLNHLGL